MRLFRDSKQQEQIKFDVLIISTLSMLAVLLWTGYSLYDTFNQSTIDPDVRSLLTPLDSTLDAEILTSLEDFYMPPEEFTILSVIRDEGNNKQVVPLSDRENAALMAESATAEEVVVESEEFGEGLAEEVVTEPEEGFIQSEEFEAEPGDLSEEVPSPDDSEQSEF